MNWLATLRTIDRLLDLEVKHGKLIESLVARIDEAVERITRLEAREQILIAEAKGAAAAAASNAASQQLTEIARHVGALQETVRHLDDHKRTLKRLPPPSEA